MERSRTEQHPDFLPRIRVPEGIRHVIEHGFYTGHQISHKATSIVRSEVVREFGRGLTLQPPKQSEQTIIPAAQISNQGIIAIINGRR